MPYIPVAANVLGTMGAVFWSIQLLPQIWLNWKRSHTRGLQSSMMLLWALAGIPLGVYNISKNHNIALKVQPQVLSSLSLITWAQCQHYKKRRSIMLCSVWTAALAITFGGVETGLVYALKPAAKRNLQWPSILMAVLSASLLALGVLRHYLDIWQHRSVRGISLAFVVLDAMGDLTSLLSLLFEPEFDVLGCVIYGTELSLWVGIIVCCLLFGFADQTGRDVELQSNVGNPPSLRTSSHTSATSVFHTVANLRAEILDP